jgi:L-asparaginase
MLMGTDKPVILTGAQIPWLQARSDALGNVHAALQFAARRDIREVAVCFGRRLMRGTRSRKRASTDFDAFDSPNAPALARIGIDLQVDTGALLPPQPCAFQNPYFATAAVTLLTVHPGLTGRSVEAMTADPALRGLILLSYGVGNLPGDDPSLCAALACASDRGVVVLNISQCWQGQVAQDTYASGAALSRLGVVEGADLTPEAAFAKLHFLLATEPAPADVRARLGQSLCGEMTVR